jgi:hypothetical protein
VTDATRWPGDRIIRAALSCSVLSWKGTFLAMVIGDHMNQSGSCFPGLDLLARETKLNRETVVNAIAELREYRILTVLRKGFPASNTYIGHPDTLEALPQIEKKRTETESPSRRPYRQLKRAPKRPKGAPQSSATPTTDSALQLSATPTPSCRPHRLSVVGQADANDSILTTPVNDSTQSVCDSSSSRLRKNQGSIDAACQSQE